MLQVSVLVVDPVHVPPWASTTVFVLVFVRRPPPQLFVQGPVHDQPPHWQLTVVITKYSQNLQNKPLFDTNNGI